MPILRALLAVLVICLITLFAAGMPTSVFVVHCEPTRANPLMWLQLVDLVAQADAYNVPLSIDFTPQWASMILEDAAKIEAIRNWIAAGHEVGCHHHGYWGTKERGSTWDGYTNTSIGELDPADQAHFLGTMDVYMSLLNSLPGERLSGCMAGSHAGDDIDYPCQLRYATIGYSLDHVATTPTEIVRNGCDVVEIGHGLIASQDQAALRALYETTSDDATFGVNGHVYNFAALPQAFIEWFRYLHALDPAGNARGTVSSVLEEWEEAQAPQQ
ncbi:hypothetical protein JW848_11010 [Candidatus Bipolaricaulota bacterium]|nr:hypothetical protein [Candidatus Bipolaricaulota bacterium]